MNEFNQEEISRNRAQRSNRALRNLSLGAVVIVGLGVVFQILAPSAAALYATGLFAMGTAAQINLRKIQSSSEQD
jgi:hypothetical protein